MAASKNRPRWNDLPPLVREQVRRLVGARVARAENCPGGFSPGFASRLMLADGRRVFVKAIDLVAWPLQAGPYRTEARVAAALPASVAAPGYLGMFDDERWVGLAFEHIDGVEPGQPWSETELQRVLAALATVAGAPPPAGLTRDHPRLGGWAELAADTSCLARLPAYAPWAVEHLDRLIALERDGLAAAQGDSLVHFDLFPHNILLTPDRVVFVDWPHARLGDPLVDLLTVLASAAADGFDPEPLLRDHPAATRPTTVDGVLAAFAGFCFAGGLSPAPPALRPIVEFKLRIGRAAAAWLRRRNDPA